MQLVAIGKGRSGHLKQCWEIWKAIGRGQSKAGGPMSDGGRRHVTISSPLIWRWKSQLALIQLRCGANKNDTCVTHPDEIFCLLLSHN